MQLSIEELKELIEDAHLDSRRKNLYGICPKCHHDEFGISLSDNHRFGCFRKKHCGFNGNIYTLLAFLGKTVAEVKPGFVPRAQLENKLLITNEEGFNLELPDCTLPFGWKPYEPMNCDYLNQRGFTIEDYKKYTPGFTIVDTRYQGFVIFPIKPYGEQTKAFIARNLKDKNEIERINNFYELKGSKRRVKRYLNSDSDFAKILGGFDEITENTTSVILVEGLFDKINVNRVLELEKQDEVKCCCTWKCSTSPEQIFLLQQAGIETVIVLYDPDVPHEIEKAAFQLELYFNTYVGYNKKGSDPGDMLFDEFDDVLSSLQTPSQFSLTTLGVKKLIKK